MIQLFLSILYQQEFAASTALQKKYVSRNIAVIELLFVTGIRISVCIAFVYA